MTGLNNQQKNKIDTGRDYFSMIPHYLVDHSFSNAQSLYLQIKRYSGEDGECFATEQTLMSKLHIGKKAFDKAKEYLLSKNFIVFAGKKSSKTRPINIYKTVDVWSMNHEFYEEKSAKSNISKKDKFQKNKDKFQKQYKINPQSNTEEKSNLIRTLKKEKNISSEMAEKIKEIRKDIHERMTRPVKDG